MIDVKSQIHKGFFLIDQNIYDNQQQFAMFEDKIYLLSKLTLNGTAQNSRVNVWSIFDIGTDPDYNFTFQPVSLENLSSYV